MARTITKRSGQTVPFNAKKIYAAIEAAAKETGEMTTNDVNQVALEVVADLSPLDNVQIETVQDTVEMKLAENGFHHTAKAYILYRQRHREQREASMKLMKEYTNLLFTDAGDMDLKRDNANIDSDAPMGIMLKLGAEGAKTYADYYAIPKEYAKADKENYIHIHDKDFSLITFNCITGDSKIVVKDNFGITRNTSMAFLDRFFNGENDAVIDVDNLDFSIPSLNGYTKIHKIMRRKHQGSVYEITLKNGSSIKATGDHIFSVKENNQLVEKNVSDININDEIPLAKYPKMNKVKHINLIDSFGSDCDIVISNSDCIRNAVSGSDKTKFYDTYKKVARGTNKNSAYYNDISLDEYMQIRHLINVDESCLTLKRIGGRTSIPAVLPVNKSLGRFIGYIFAEGYINENAYQISFANQDKCLIDRFLKAVKELFPETKYAHVDAQNSATTSNADVITLLGGIFPKLFKSKHFHKEGSADIYFGEWIYDAPKEFIQGFLEAEIDSDGDVDEGYRARLSTVSEKLAQQIHYLLCLNNITSCLTTNETEGTIAYFPSGKSSVRKYDMYRISFDGKNLDDLADFIPDSIKIKKSNLSRKRHVRKDGKVVKIEMFDYDGYVYDFETEDHHFAVNGMISHNCCQIDLGKLFKGGFSTGHGFLREPNSIRAAASLACIAIQSNQNDMFGGQSINALDVCLAPYVDKSFVKAIKNTTEEWMEFNGYASHPMDFSKMKYGMPIEEARKIIFENINVDDLKAKSIDADRIYLIAKKNVDDETMQAMEALIHNFNTLHSRAGKMCA